MTKLRRAVSVALALAAAAMLATSSLGFTSVTAERGVAVNVVDAEDAYVGVQACEKNRGGGSDSNPVRVRVTNQYSQPFTVADVTSDTGDSLAEGQRGEEVGVGERATFESLRADSEVTVRVTGALDATVTAPVQVKSNCPSSGSAAASSGPASAATTQTASGNETATTENGTAATDDESATATPSE